LVCALVGAASAFLISTQVAKVYEARATLVAQTIADTFAAVAVSKPVLGAVVAQLHLPVTPAALADRVEARPSRTSALLTIIASDPDAERAAAIANAVADQLVLMAPQITGSSSDTERAIQADLATLQTEIARTEIAADALSKESDLTEAQRATLQVLQSQLATLVSVRSSLLDFTLSYSKSLLTRFASADAPSQPSSPQPQYAAAVGGLLGFALGMGCALVLNYALLLPGPRIAKTPESAAPIPQ
jgi:capsular polysaccharide biosynthesis protein